MNRRAGARWLRGAVLLPAFLAAGCALPGRPKEADQYRRPDRVLDFATLYRQNCAACHGADGKLGPAPPLNDPLFAAIVPAEELVRVITDGRHGTLMPSFAQVRGQAKAPKEVEILTGTLTTQQIQVLADNLRTRWGQPRQPPDNVPPYFAPKAAGNKDAGLAVFARACAGCHGDRGQSGSHEGRPIGAINEPAFLGLLSNQALRRIILTGRPDLGMPDYAESHGRPKDFKPLSAEEVTDLVALLASWRQGERQ